MVYDTNIPHAEHPGEPGREHTLSRPINSNPEEWRCDFFSEKLKKMEQKGMLPLSESKQATLLSWMK